MSLRAVIDDRRCFEVLFGQLLVDELLQFRLVGRQFNRKIKEFLEAVEECLRARFSKHYGKWLAVTSVTCIYVRSGQTSPTYKRNAHQHSADDAIDRACIYRSYVLAYSYQCRDRKKAKLAKLFWELQFDVTRSNRTVWVYREETRNHFTKERIPLIQDIMPVRIGDCLQLEVPVLTSFGLSDISSLEFYPFVEERASERVCSIETQFEWTLHKYFEHPVQFEVDDIVRCYPENLEVKQIRCAGVGYYNYRIQLKCIKPGLLSSLMGHEIRVLERNDPVTVRLKKRGAYDQQRSVLELRVEDLLTIYFTPNE